MFLHAVVVNISKSKNESKSQHIGAWNGVCSVVVNISKSKNVKGEYQLEYQFDAISLLNYYKGVFTNSALERITGINQKQLQHYASGLKKPRETQIQKIENGLHRLANELLAVKL